MAQITCKQSHSICTYIYWQISPRTLDLFVRLRFHSHAMANHRLFSVCFIGQYQPFARLRLQKWTEKSWPIASQIYRLLTVTWSYLAIQFEVKIISIRWIRTHSVHFLHSFPFVCLYSLKCEAAFRNSSNDTQGFLICRP